MASHQRIPALPRRALLLLIALTSLAACALPAAQPPTPTPGLTPRPSPPPTRTATPAPPTATPTATPPPTPTPDLTPRLTASASTSALTVTLRLDAVAPAGAAEALLWYDAPSGREVRRIALDGSQRVQASVTITPSEELGLAPHCAAAPSPCTASLDYWWALRDRSGALARVAGTQALAPFAALAPPPPGPVAWVARDTPTFRLRAVPGSDAARDLDRLAQVAEASFAQASAILPPASPISVTVYLVPRVFWQGGVAHGAGGPLIISYLDRNYVAVEPWSYFVHEVTHALGSALVPRGAEVGGLLGEGLAVYVGGGHYGVEPIHAWAAVVAQSDAYVPLCELRYDFYAAQHETAYIEAGSFTGFLIEAYGPEAFREMYRAQQPQRGTHGVDRATFCDEDNRRVLAPTGKTSAELEQDWLAYLATLAPSDEERRAWELTVRFFETMRRYEEALDPPARMLPPPPDHWDPAVTAAMLSPAEGWRAAALETMLRAVGEAIGRGDIEHAAALLDALDASIAAGGPVDQTPAGDYGALAALIETQARALRLGDAPALAATLATPELALALPFQASDLLSDMRLTPVQIDVRGAAAEGLVEAHGAALDGRRVDGALYRARWAREGGAWRLTAWEPHAPAIDLPPGPSVS